MLFSRLSPRPLILLTLAAALPALAERKPPAPNTAAPGRGIFRGALTANRFDLSRPLRDLPEVVIAKDQGREFDEERDADRSPVNGPFSPDGALQKDYPQNAVAIPAPLVTFNGPGNAQGVAPPDPVGDVGPNHYIIMKNSAFQIYSKTGTSILGPNTINTLWSGFGGPCQTENAGDPIIIHDQLADRWVIGQFTAAGPNYFICLAVSQSPDPTGAYYRWAITTGTNFPDYPKLGLMPDGYYISTREFAGNSFAGIGAYVINRQQALAGNPAATIISMLATAAANPAYNLGDGLHPADMDGTFMPPAGRPQYYLGSMDNGSTKGAPQDALTLWKFTPNWTTPASSTFLLTNTINTAAFDSVFPCTPASRDCIAQPGTTRKLDILSYRQRVTNRVAYRNFGTHESLVTSQSVEATAGVAGMRWYELRSPNSAPVIFQQSTYSPDALNRWMGSISQDRNGNMALAYSVSSATVNPGVRYTGRLVSDPLNQMPQGEGTIIAGTGSETGSQRWGDYTSTNIDPDGCRFWHVNEWVPVTGSFAWVTRVGAFRFAGCVDLPILLRNAALANLTPTLAQKNLIFPRAGDPALAAADKVQTLDTTTAPYPQESTDYSTSTNPIIFFQMEGAAGNTLRVAKNAAAGKLVVSF